LVSPTSRRNMPPASTLESWRWSPTSANLPRARPTTYASRAKSRVASWAASSTITSPLPSRHCGPGWERAFPTGTWPRCRPAHPPPFRAPRWRWPKRPGLGHAHRWLPRRLASQPAIVLPAPAGPTRHTSDSPPGQRRRTAWA
jgi:hypothetical protein